MTKSIQQIKQNLNNIEATAVETGIELEKLYQDYLDLLSQSVKQQLILASYQICTQFYPQPFLDLSLSSKQDLQQILRQIGTEIKPILLKIIEQKELEPEPRELNLMAELIKNLPKAKSRKDDLADDQESENEARAAEMALESVKAELENIENIEFIEIDSNLEEDSLEAENSEPQIQPLQAINLENPKHLVLWHQQIERKIKKVLDITSKKINQQLQKSQIIPDRIPSKIIDVAIQTDSSTGGSSNRKLQNVPNILHLVIESDRDKKSNSAKNTIQVSLLRLRLAELEFSDPILNAQRGQIRNLVSQIKKLNNQYKAVKHEADIAEAQAAWRSSWYED